MHLHNYFSKAYYNVSYIFNDNLTCSYDCSLVETMRGISEKKNKLNKEQ